MSDESDIDGVDRGWGARLLSTTRVAGSALRLAGRRLRKAKDTSKDGEIGVRLAEELDGMKGLAMKIGQILSYFDGVLPDEAHAALRALQQGERAVVFETMAPVVDDAFGERVDDLFDSFDREPIASASIGQVYRASLDGEPVAVKIQYPGIEKTFEADFKRIRKLARLASLASAVDGLAIADELRQTIGRECDYLQEASWQEAFRQAFEADAGVSVPAVVHSRTRRQVLTTHWCDGRSLYAYVDSASADARSEMGRLLIWTAFRSLFGFGAINADPHPGNYLFPEEGGVVLLDYGCVREFDDETVEAERRLARVVVDGDRANFRDAAMATGMVATPARFDFEVHWRMMRHQYQPYIESSFEFTPGWIREGMEFNGPSNPNGRRINIPPPWIWIQRLEYGLHAVLSRLGARGDFRDVFRSALALPLNRLGVDS